MPACLADKTAPAVASDEVFRAQRTAVIRARRHAGIVLRESSDLACRDRSEPLSSDDPVGEKALDLGLPKPEPVVVARRQIAGVQDGSRKHHDRMLLALRDEPIGDAALVELFDRAWKQTACARAREFLVDAPLDDGDVDARQRQLAASINPVGPPPAITTACSVIVMLQSTQHPTCS